MNLLREVIDGISTLIGLVIGWLLLGAVLSLFAGPEGFGLSAMFMAIFWIFPDDAPSSCSCEHERVYSAQEMGEGLHLKDRHRFERREPVAFERREPVAPLPAVPAVAAPRHDPFDASYRKAHAAAWARAVRHHVPSIALTTKPARVTKGGLGQRRSR
jgi:hypothetical protein